MSNDENYLQKSPSSTTSVNKSKLVLVRNSNRVSFSESINKSLPPENDYEEPKTSSAVSTKTTSWSSSSPPPSSTYSSSTALKRITPILFSSNRGLHLRVTSSGKYSNNIQRSTSSTEGKQEVEGSGNSIGRSRRTTTTSINSSYNIAFCDLERWSTNRANTVSLEDTFTISRPAIGPHFTASGSLASNSLRFLPQKTNSIRFKGYSRFDVE